jgi:hypothetical protein
LQRCYPIRLYAGYDPREEVGYHAFCSSVIEHASVPVSITALSPKAVSRLYTEGQRDGTNAFIYLRFLIPYLQDFEGMAIFADGSDMVMSADIAELAKLYDPFKAVQVVKHSYKTRHPRKYIGTQMESANEDYQAKNWSSLMLINCAHYAWRQMTPDAVAKLPGYHLHRFEFIEPERVGELPSEWNCLVDEGQDATNAKLLHWTCGIPAFPQYRGAAMAHKWHEANARANHATQ